jgi:hypothetical protein
VKVYTIRRSHTNGAVRLAVHRTTSQLVPQEIMPRVGYLFQYGYIGTGPRHLAQQLLIDCLENGYAAAANCSAFALAFFGPPSRQKNRIEITQREVVQWLKNRVIAGAAA